MTETVTDGSTTTRPSGATPLRYYAAVTDGPSVFRRMLRLLEDAGPFATDPLGRLLVTPLQLGPPTLSFIRDLSATRGATVCFDSGGYYVQVGKLAYEELYMRLLRLYQEQPWADVYVLPDNVPTSRETPEQVWTKVRQTAQWSRMFFEELPSKLQERAMPVVHGHTLEQADYCLSEYLAMGARTVGFGSFGTFGKQDGVNLAHADSTKVASWVVREAGKHGVPVHFFGLGVPALVAMIAGLGATSFDSSAWLKAAGFGQVTLPFQRAYNITYRSAESELQRGILWEDLQELKVLTGHSCPYCESWERLAESKWHRAAHNLISLHESVQILNDGQYERIDAIYEGGSPKYQQEGVRWLRNT